MGAELHAKAFRKTVAVRCSGRPPRLPGYEGRTRQAETPAATRNGFAALLMNCAFFVILNDASAQRFLFGSQNDRASLRMTGPRSNEFVERSGLALAHHRKLAAAERCANRDERQLHGFAGITIPRDVREVHAAPVRTRDFAEQLARGLIREVSVTSTDPLLQGPRSARVCLQQFRAVVGFDHDDVAAAEVFADVLRRVSKIGEKSQRVSRGE